jgi:hypothetical protein
MKAEQPQPAEITAEASGPKLTPRKPLSFPSLSTIDPGRVQSHSAVAKLRIGAEVLVLCALAIVFAALNSGWQPPFWNRLVELGTPVVESLFEVVAILLD